VIARYLFHVSSTINVEGWPASLFAVNLSGLPPWKVTRQGSRGDACFRSDDFNPNTNRTELQG
jgi:hypothetical protein